MSGCAWIIIVYAWICLNKSDYLLMPEYALIYLNCLSGFALYVPIVIMCLLEWMVTYFSKVYSLKEHEAFFFNKRQNWIFSRVAASIWFVFCFRLNIFSSKIWDFLLSLRVKWASGRESWYTKFQYLIDVKSTIYCVLNQTDLIWHSKY